MVLNKLEEIMYEPNILLTNCTKVSQTTGTYNTRKEIS